MRIRPCIDIHNGRVKQIVGGTLKDQEDRIPGSARENFVADKDAAYYASVYRDMDLQGGHIILLNSVREKAYAEDKIQAMGALAAFPGGMQIGGGITPESAGAFLGAGASHVIVTSYVFRDGKLSESALEEMIRAVGRWQKFTNLEISADTLDRLSAHCDEFLIHAADVEGKRSGIEENLVTVLGEWQQKSGFPVTYAGGVHSFDDLKLIGELSGGRMDVTVGSALSLFGGNLSLEDLVKTAKEI